MVKKTKEFSEGDIRVFFMPIVSLFNGQIFGYEALARDKDIDKFPADLFEEAKRAGINALVGLNMACIKKALEEVSKPYFPKDKLLFLNVSPPIFKRKEFQKLFLARDLPLAPWNIVFEIIEEEIENIDELKAAVQPLLNVGYSLATDDQGAKGTCGLRMLQLTTRYVKIDLEFAGLCLKKDRFGTFEGYVRDTNDLTGLVVVEGIEDYWDARDLVEFYSRQAALGQGYLFGKAKPVEEIDIEIPERAKAVLKKMWQLRERD